MTYRCNDDQFHETIALEMSSSSWVRFQSCPKSPSILSSVDSSCAEAFLALNGRWHGCSMSKPCSLWRGALFRDIVVRAIGLQRIPSKTFLRALNITRLHIGSMAPRQRFQVYFYQSFSTIKVDSELVHSTLHMVPPDASLQLSVGSLGFSMMVKRNVGV